MPLHAHHAFIVSKPPIELAVADVHREDPYCAMLEHAVGEAARGRANVHTDHVFKAYPVFGYRFFELQAAPADEGYRVLLQREHLPILHGVARLHHANAVKKHDALHDQRLCPLAALCKPKLHKLIIRSFSQS